MEHKEITAAILTAAIIKQSNKQPDKLVNYACDTYKEILRKLEAPAVEKADPSECAIDEAIPEETKKAIPEEPKKKKKSKSK